MPIAVGAFPGLDLNYLIFAGRVTRQEALAFPGRIDPSRSDFGCRWLTLFESGADMSDLDAPCLLAIKERLTPVVVRLGAKGTMRSILVSNSKYNDHLMDCWRAMVAADPAYPSDPETAASVREACGRHGLCVTETAWVENFLEYRLRAPADGETAEPERASAARR